MKVWNQQIIRQQLVNKSKEMRLRLPQMQMLLAQERFLARLYSLPEGKHFIWKGGSLLLRKYSALEVPRYTVDIDLLLKGIDYKNTLKLLKKASSLELNDGFKYSDVIVVTPMERDIPYGGDGYELNWKMFGKNQSVPLRIDVATGDVVDDEKDDFSSLSIILDNDLHISAYVYPAEYIFAEKLETVFRFGTGNTRAKDIVDLWTLINFGMNKTKIKKTVQICFKNRETEFSIIKLQGIFEDSFFVKNLERLFKAKYSYLNLPEVKEILELVIMFCRNNL